MTVNKTAIGFGIFVLLFSTVVFTVLYWRYYNKQERPNIVFIIADDMVSASSYCSRLRKTIKTNFNN